VGRGPEPGRDVGEDLRLERGEAAEREERREGDILGWPCLNFLTERSVVRLSLADQATTAM